MISDSTNKLKGFQRNFGKRMAHKRPFFWYFLNQLNLVAKPYHLEKSHLFRLFRPVDTSANRANQLINIIRCCTKTERREAYYQRKFASCGICHRATI